MYRVKIVFHDHTLISDTDECAIEGICGSHSICTNIPGSHECDCIKGYEMDNEKKCKGKQNIF